MHITHMGDNMVVNAIRGRSLRAFAALVLLATTLAAAPSQLGAQGTQLGVPTPETERFVVITVENNQEADSGFFFTSMWAGLHSGDFDLFNEGESASPGLELLAEDGDPSTLQEEFGQQGRLQDQVGPTPIAPGTTHTEAIPVISAPQYPYISFASMLLPSNDAFFGNEAPDAYRIFDENGTPTGPVTIEILGSDIYDAGTESNTAVGLPFIVDGMNGSADPEADGGVVTPLSSGLVEYLDLETAPGAVVDSEIEADELVATITIEVVEQANEQVHVRVENLQEEGGFFFTSVWAGLHGGDFDLFNEGDEPSAGLELLAEDGDPSTLQEEFGQRGRLQDQVGPTPIAPGGIFESSIDVINPEAYPFFSYASMMLPSNDAFFGNEVPDAYQIFDDDGRALEPIEIYVFAEDVYDAGTEENTGTGLPFIVDGMNGTADPAPDGGVVTPLGDALEPYVGLPTAPGADILTALASEEPIAKITVYAGPARTCGGEEVTVSLALGQVPTEGDDVILGTDGADVINGLGGNDIICGERGADIIRGGPGNDRVFGGAGADTISLGRGNDTAYGQGGDDVIRGNRGNDTLIGLGGNDVLRGNNGTDSLTGGGGRDLLVGGKKADFLSGDAGRDELQGRQGPDFLDGGDGADIINGGGAEDTCIEDGDDASVVNCEDVTEGP